MSRRAQGVKSLCAKDFPKTGSVHGGVHGGAGGCGGPADAGAIQAPGEDPGGAAAGHGEGGPDPDGGCAAGPSGVAAGGFGEGWVGTHPTLATRVCKRYHPRMTIEYRPER